MNKSYLSLNFYIIIDFFAIFAYNKKGEKSIPHVLLAAVCVIFGEGMQAAFFTPPPSWRHGSVPFFDGAPHHKLEGEYLLLLWQGGVFDMLQQ